MGGYVGFGSWGNTFSTNYYDLSLKVAPVDDSIDTISRAFSSGIPYMIDENGEKTQDDPLVQFLLEPNKHQNFKEFSKEWIRNLFASGFAYLYPTSENDAFVRRLDMLDSANRPELIALNSDYISYKGMTFFGFIDKRNQFDYQKNGAAIPMNFDDVIPFWDKVQDPENFRLGISRMCALKDEITNIMLANRAKTNKIKQSGKFIATPSTKSLNQSIGNQLDQVVDIKNPAYKQRDLMEDQLATTGLAQDKAIIVVKQEIDVKNVMESIQNYSYDDEVKEDKRTIKNSYGIPRELQNIGDDQAKYSDRKEAYLELFTLHILPLATNFTESIQNHYDPNNKKKLILDYSHHPAFEISKDLEQEKMQTQTETLISLFEKNIIDLPTITDKLKAYGII